MFLQNKVHHRDSYLKHNRNPTEPHGFFSDPYFLFEILFFQHSSNNNSKSLKLLHVLLHMLLLQMADLVLYTVPDHWPNAVNSMVETMRKASLQIVSTIMQYHLNHHMMFSIGRPVAECTSGNVNSLT